MIGRIVLYTMPDGRKLPAICTESVSHDGLTINLHAIDNRAPNIDPASGPLYFRDHVTYDAGGAAGHWSWPPWFTPG